MADNVEESDKVQSEVADLGKTEEQKPVEETAAVQEDSPKETELSPHSILDEKHDEMDIGNFNVDPEDVKSDRSEPHKDEHHDEFFLLPIEEEVENLPEEEVVEEEVLDREVYYALYLRHLVDYGSTKRLNNFLHKKMAEYFKKRKMEHVLIEGDHADEGYIKYTKKLNIFYELIEKNKQQRGGISDEMRKLKGTRDSQLAAADEAFKDMLDREKEIGTGLISTKTGKEIPEKVLEKMIHIQRDKALELQDLRLIHIKIGNGVQDKLVTLKSMDKIGDNYTLMEFEQLKMENEGHADKIEERDEDLANLRRKCNAAIQCLAHVREKCSAIELQIKSMRATVESKDRVRLQVREEVNKLKQERDYYRTETQNMKAQSGLLTKDKLLIDMEISMEGIRELEKELERTKKLYAQRQAKINAIKSNYEKESRKPKYRMLKIMRRNTIERETPSKKTPKKTCHVVNLELKAIQSVNSLAK